MRNFYLFVLFLAQISLSAQIVNIPDPYFKTKLLSATPATQIAKDLNGNWTTIDANNDGEIQLSEALAISDIGIYNNSNQTSVSTYQIQSVEGIKAFANLIYLDLSNFANLTSIDVSGMQKLRLVGFDDDPKLASVNFTNCNLLETIYVRRANIVNLNVSNLPKLNILDCSGGSIQTINYAGSTTLKLFFCDDNNITSINVAPLTNLVRFTITQNALTSLDVSNHLFLERLSCSSNQLTSLNLQNTPKLNNLEASFNNLTSLNVSQSPLLNYIRAVNNQITSIDVSALPALQTLKLENNQLTTLNIANNYQLTYPTVQNNNLQTLFLKNGKIQSINYANNPNLTYICCDEGEINQMITSNNGYGYNNVVVNSYCNFTPGGTYFTIQGNTKYDENSNGCDPNDINKPLQKFNISGNGSSGSFTANGSGDFSIPVVAGSHTIVPVLENPAYFNISPSSITASFPSQTSPLTQNFCLTANGTHHDLEVLIIPTTVAVPGFDAKYKIVYKNKGNTTQSGTLTLAYNDNLMDYQTSTVTPNAQSTGLLTWNFTNLHPFETKEITVTQKMNTPTATPPLNGGDILHHTVQINGASDDTPADNTFTLNQTVVNSFDPNDKTCLEGTSITQTQVGDYVHYLIRFENTGSANAQNIVVKDEIDISKYDLSTLIALNGSHNFVTKTTGPNVIEFIFENIQLPFDDAHNDGYVSFKIKTKSTLTSGDSFSNTAKIYFDYNHPIITNTYTTTVENKLGTSDIKNDKSDISIYPNPVQDVVYIKSKTEVLKAEIFDATGRIVRITSVKDNSINVVDLPKGNYIIRLFTKEKTAAQKFIKH
ncbi:T9SS type A sorting domain-containing protein [Chryseobacterium sp. JUb7]|uniref:DUF7619 domain-containing protein n=1 Tax=Chryseobacterium sp. JUb7 TaxID=2940599 RepID=UPI002168F66D|nr:T9SS type A sorting domain-containing protein [Chryseobacterium sp. JUb7]MCS3529726.1 hypothetical protein [Chryseobacterium sp. JUb7]